MLLPTFLFSALPLGALAGRGAAHRRIAHAQNIVARANKTYSLTDLYQGESFLTDWDFFSGSDPTHGSVAYQTKSGATNKGLAYVQDDGTTVLAVDATTALPLGTPRDSVRISTKKTYDGGLFVADFWAMPHGCSVWPAYWSAGPAWPDNGEIDIVEGVNLQANNQYTLHTTAGCTQSSGGEALLGNVVHTACASSDGDNTGCVIGDGDGTTFGSGFNKQAGGVFAHLWNDDGIRFWRFARGAIPQDIADRNPNPAGWGAPVAVFSADTCEIGKFFRDHVLTLDTTLCGDWAGAAYGGSGCPGTCAQAVADPSNYKYAKWEINYIAVYN